jgi:hypothetical protein
VEALGERVGEMGTRRTVGRVEGLEAADDWNETRQAVVSKQRVPGDVEGEE